MNIGNPDEMHRPASWPRKIIELTGSPSQIVFRPLPEDDPKVRQPDITRAAQAPGLGAQGRLRDGLQTTIDYFRQKLGI